MLSHNQHACLTQNTCYVPMSVFNLFNSYYNFLAVFQKIISKDIVFDLWSFLIIHVIVKKEENLSFFNVRHNMFVQVCAELTAMVASAVLRQM